MLRRGFSGLRFWPRRVWLATRAKWKVCATHAESRDCAPTRLNKRVASPQVLTATLRNAPLWPVIVACV